MSSAHPDRLEELVHSGKTNVIKSCQHPQVVVDYLHPYADLIGIRVNDLQASDPTMTRPVMTLQNPRCAECGKRLTRAELRRRMRPGGDLYDPRFLWSG
jgi:hypothetical protein